ncbi:hypothetical protein ACFL5Q_06560 [Planctomycetota bacterium]
MRPQTAGMLVAGLLPLVVTTTGCDGTFGKQVGMVVIYEVEADEASPGAKLSDPVMKKLMAAMDRRLNPGRRTSGRIRQLDDGRIEVSVFRADPEVMQRIADLLPLPGTLEFRVLANRRDHPLLVKEAVEVDGRELRGPDGDVLAWWLPVMRGEEERLLQFVDSAETVSRKRTHRDYEWTEFLVVKDIFNLNGSYLTNARASFDSSGRPCVLFTFNHSGGKRLEGLTGDNLPNEADGFHRHLGIILDGHIKSAPAIRSTISRRAEITGDFTRQEVQDLVDVLNAGSLPAAIRKVEERVVDVEKHASP